MTKDEIYKIIQSFLEKREDQDIPLTKEGLLVRTVEKDYVIKVIKKKS